MNNSSIWKYPLKITDAQTLMVPGKVTPLSVQFQRGELCLWCLVADVEAENEALTVYIVGTGNPFPSVAGLRFIGTAQYRDGSLVWHIFYDARQP